MTRKLNKLSKPILDYYERNESGDSEIFAERFAPYLAYDHSLKRWFIFKEHFWEEDRNGKIYEAVKFVAEVYKKASKDMDQSTKEGFILSQTLLGRCKQLLAKQRIKNVLYLASQLPKIGLTGDEWNISPMLLPVANGIIDLTTGKLRDGNPDDFINVFCPTNFVGLKHPAPTWEKFISDICGDDREQILFLQRLLGYAITGETREQILPIFLGDGSNGKSTLMDLLANILGNSFSLSTQADSLMNSRMSNGEGAKPFVCALRNKRFVWASESQNGQFLNIGLIKQLTGDQHITARELYGKPITFPPTHTIFLITNSLPSLPDGSDYALQRRLIVFEFKTSFVDNPTQPNHRKCDKDIIRKLREEGPGILAWLVRGTLAWQEKGLNPPEACKIATANYHENEDLLGQYTKENLTIGETYEVLACDLYADYAQWCKNNGFVPMSNKSFGHTMTKEYGASKPKTVDGKSFKSYKGVQLVSDKFQRPDIGG